MAEISRTKTVRAGAWRTLESGWNATFSCRFLGPAGAKVKVRYGGGWPFGMDSQTTTLDGSHPKTLSVGGGSIAYARVQIKVQTDTQVSYTYITVGP